MAGHNKWSKIKHRKAIVERRRGKIWTKVAKAIIVAARHGGPDPVSNLTLRYAMDEARYANMPRETVERAIRKGAGGEDTSNYEIVRYEGYAKGSQSGSPMNDGGSGGGGSGVAVIVDALTDNRTRTAGHVRLAFSDHGANLGSSGCVSYMFHLKGQIYVASAGVHEDALLTLSLDAGADDVVPPESADAPWLVSTTVPAYLRVKDALERAMYVVVESGFDMIPAARIAVSGAAASALTKFIEALEDLDDVQKVYTNADLPDE